MAITHKQLRIEEDGPTGGAAGSLHQLGDAELLPGWYEDWAVIERTRLRQDCLRAFNAISQKTLTLWDFQTAVEAAEPIWPS